ncbi:hypothetical protein cypCar_00015931 [Cyprinus carpio]|nr:hypothetical protein cypCar_00015931 [Cyprinus carpio]
MGIKLRVILGMFQFVSFTRIPTQCAKTPVSLCHVRSDVEVAIARWAVIRVASRHASSELAAVFHNGTKGGVKPLDANREPQIWRRQGPQTTRKGRQRQRGKPKRKKHIGKKPTLVPTTPPPPPLPTLPPSSAPPPPVREACPPCPTRRMTSQPPSCECRCSLKEMSCTKRGKTLNQHSCR